MTKQILAFLFCFKRELNPYSPLKARGFIKPSVLTLTLTSARVINAPPTASHKGWVRV